MNRGENNFLNNKKGQGLSTNAIILIILGVLVLVVLIVGFSLGWGKIAPWVKSNNVDATIQSCSIACSTNSKFDFCSLERELKFDGSVEGLVSGQKYTCNELLVYNETLGMSGCPSITC